MWVIVGMCGGLAVVVVLGAAFLLRRRRRRRQLAAAGTDGDAEDGSTRLDKGQPEGSDSESQRPSRQPSTGLPPAVGGASDKGLTPGGTSDVHSQLMRTR